MENISRNEFELLVRRAGLSLSCDKLDELHGAWGLVEPILARIRGTARDRTAEPSSVFHADAYPLRNIGQTETS